MKRTRMLVAAVAMMAIATGCGDEEDTPEPALVPDCVTTIALCLNAFEIAHCAEGAWRTSACQNGSRCETTASGSFCRSP